MYFIKDQQELPLVAERAQPAQKLRRHNPHAALALDRLDHDGPRRWANGFFDGVNIRNRDLIEAFYLGPESFDVFGLAARRDHGQRAAVKGALES